MEKIKIITPNDEGYSNQEHICLSCNQDRKLCPPYTGDFVTVYACACFNAGIKNKEEYPHIIRKLIRTINEIGLDKITYIQTSVLEVTSNEVPQTQHQYIDHIEEVEFEDNVVFISNEWGRYCLYMDRIIGFGIKKEKNNG
jgi:hypothetical protein